ncbi:PREDICTED: uncharacterized protein LOC108372963 [Rhagoletis zephyria]|uniref:uncharacterized protein LOC108372963 n=1 Tax=Rhagoletis zephyria TaxID=28612 RepID=UPI0008117FD4|nr:PREDICTED: uncharacterized protein LOC108372963 [Rhagoletis zephyria]
MPKLETIFNKWQLNAILFAIAISGVAFVHGKFYRECIGAEKSQKFVASLDNCAKYIYCDGNNSFEGECLDDNYFNVNVGKCDERSAVVCNVGVQVQLTVEGSQNSQGSLGSSHSVGALDGERVDDKNVATIFDANVNSNSIMNTNNLMSNNNNWHTLVGLWSSQQQQQQQQQQEKQQQLQSAMLSGGVIGSEPVTGLALNGIDMGNAATAAIAANQAPQCPLRYGLNNVIYLANAASCTSYYTCYNGIAIPMICPRGTYFNEETSRCERQENVYCSLYRPVRLICNRGVYDYIPHARNCGYYYFCSNGYLMIFQCPFQYLWHYERRTCVHSSQAKCFSRAIAEAMLS